MTRTKMFLIFFLFGFGGSWLIDFASYQTWSTPYARSLAILHALPLLITTLLLQGPILKQPILKPLGLNLAINKWWLTAWLLPIFILFLSIFISYFFFKYDFVSNSQEFIAFKRTSIPQINLAQFDQLIKESPPPSPWTLILQALLPGITINLMVALISEIAFRGFLFREIQGDFWKRALTIGFLNGLWLMPMSYFGYPYNMKGILPVLLILIWSLLASIILIYLRVRTQSLIGSSIWLGTMYALTGVISDLVVGKSLLIRSLFGISTSFAMSFIIIIFFLYEIFSNKPPLLFKRKNNS